MYDSPISIYNEQKHIFGALDDRNLPDTRNWTTDDFNVWNTANLLELSKLTDENAILEKKHDIAIVNWRLVLQNGMEEYGSLWRFFESLNLIDDVLQEAYIRFVDIIGKFDLNKHVTLGTFYRTSKVFIHAARRVSKNILYDGKISDLSLNVINVIHSVDKAVYRGDYDEFKEIFYRLNLNYQGNIDDESLKVHLANFISSYIYLNREKGIKYEYIESSELYKFLNEMKRNSSNKFDKAIKIIELHRSISKGGYSLDDENPRNPLYHLLSKGSIDSTIFENLLTELLQGLDDEGAFNQIDMTPFNTLIQGISSDRTKGILYLRYVDDQTLEQIASRYNISPERVRQILNDSHKSILRSGNL